MYWQQKKEFQALQNASMKREQLTHRDELLHWMRKLDFATRLSIDEGSFKTSVLTSRRFEVCRPWRPRHNNSLTNLAKGNSRETPSVSLRVLNYRNRMDNQYIMPEMFVRENRRLSEAKRLTSLQKLSLAAR